MSELELLQKISEQLEGIQVSLNLLRWTLFPICLALGGIVGLLFTRR